VRSHGGIADAGGRDQITHATSPTRRADGFVPAYAPSEKPLESAEFITVLKSALVSLRLTRFLETTTSNMADHREQLSKSTENESKLARHVEHGVDSKGNLAYENAEEEPDLTARTWIALASMWLLNLVQVLALQGPPAVVCPRCLFS